MPHHQPPQLKRASRGQALVLAALSLLLLGLMVALSFNLSHALRGKMRLQQHSDALAYSMAIVEARTFNYFAASNRAIAASYVAMNSLHAYMAAATVTTAMMTAARNNFYQIAAMEFAQCACKTCFIHCIHGMEALKIAGDFSREANDYADKISNAEDNFNKSVKSLDDMMNAIHKSQHGVFRATQTALRTGSAYGLDKLKRVNAPRASELNQQVGNLNVGEFTCAIDGTQCNSQDKPANTSLPTRAKVMTEVANATRPDWPANRGSPSPIPLYLHPQFLQDLMQDIQGEGITTPVSHDGTAKTVHETGHGPLHQGQSSDNDGKVSSADEHGQLFSQWKHGIGFSSYEVEIASSTEGGEHKPGSAHQGQHDRYEGNYVRELMQCQDKGNCFMKFRADPDPKHDYGQPHVYAYVTQRLRMGNVQQAPWELNDSASVTFTHGGNGTATVQLAAEEGAAVSKAFVYYHRLGDWREQPNMFNPFWRAKLHPFSPGEAARVLQAAGNTDAAQLSQIPGVPQ